MIQKIKSKDKCIFFYVLIKDLNACKNAVYIVATTVYYWLEINENDTWNLETKLPQMCIVVTCNFLIA
jgi:hypothetical protein